MRNIGVFGGTFDPVHNAHIAVAEAAKESLKLDFVIMMTGGNPPHKRDRKILDAKIRHIMLKKAIKGHSGLIACDWEIKRDEYSYSVNTLRFLKRIFPEDRIFFIIGSDCIDTFDTWREPQEICRLCTLSVYQREGCKKSIESLKKKYNADIVTVDGVFLDVSSSRMRKDAAFMKENTNAEVFSFIKKYRLYCSAEDEISVLKRLLKPERFKHSMGVAKYAVMLAEKFGEDTDTAYTAGLLHDIAKNIPYEESLVMCSELEAELDPIEKNIPALVHPKLGAELVKCYFGIQEGAVTSAIRYHTIGRVNMSVMDKIIFVSDMCEQSRNFQGIEDIRAMSQNNLDKAVIMCIDSTVKFNNDKGAKVHPMAYRVREDVLKNL